jgi:Flp pilus assembly pilin Flp
MTESRRHLQGDRGAALVEYALLLALLVLVLAGAVSALQDSEAQHLESSGQRVGMPDLDVSPPPPPTSSTVPGQTDPTDPPPTVYVSLDEPVGTAEPTQGNSWQATVTFGAWGESGALEGVVITGVWSPSHAQHQTTSCTTDASGTCAVVRWSLNNNQVDEATFTVTDISGSGYAPASGVIGTTTTVQQPGTEPPPEGDGE